VSVRWTDEQVRAITATDDTLLSASAGTGKTTTVVGRILWSLGLDVGRSQAGIPVPPCPHPIAMEEIAAITFTEKAAHDLKDKLRSSIEPLDPDGRLRWDLERATVGTIHGFAAALLREYALRLGIDPNFRILDPRETEMQQTEVVREVLAEALRERDEGAVALTRRYGLVGWKMAPGAIERVLSVLRDLRWRAHQFEAWSHPLETGRYTRTLDREGLRERARFAGAWSNESEAAAHDEVGLELADALYRLGRASVGVWLSWIEKENARDFDSLILDARRLLTRPEAAEARDAIRDRFRLLIIDEFQDTDWAQWEIAKAMAGLELDNSEPDIIEPDNREPDDIGPDDVERDATGADNTAADATPARQGPQLFLVGDPKQSIYRFRGADIDVWNEARGVIEASGQSLALSWNFRSDPRLVEFVNRVGARALEETARPLEQSAPGSVVHYDALRSARPPSPAAGLEWLAVDSPGNAQEKREEEARSVASRIRHLLGAATVVDPDDGTTRPCEAGDIAILARRNDDLTALEPTLRAYDIPFYNTATSGLAEQQEVLDLVTALRLIENRFDDLRSFAFLRSPFVGLRDEVLVRVGLYGDDRRRSFLERATDFLEATDAGREGWYAAPENDHIEAVERAALREGLAALAEAHSLADRVDHAEVLETVLTRTGYRLHLLIRDGAAESLANIERFLALLDEYRHLTLGRFLALWERWGERDLGIPQARLYSSGDDVVTLSTIHAAKGLEWPIVVMAGTEAPLAEARRFVGAHWTDPVLGPVLLPRTAEQGPRAKLALSRRLEQEQAEEARLLYVAATRARDRLIVSAPAEDPKKGFAGWLAPELENARELHQVSDVEGDVEPDEARGASLHAIAGDERTGTGSQLDVFGVEDAARRQLDLFGSGERADDPEALLDGFVIIRRAGVSVQTSFGPAPVTLRWLDDIEAAEWPESAGDLAADLRPRVGSATERMMRQQNPEAWARRYLHGVLETTDFLPAAAPDEGLPARTRGTLIHGVLERIAAEEELARVLEETIASLDLADLESALAPGSSYRDALERELADVVRSPQWQWYVEGEHYRELPFIHRSAEGWVLGAFDLYRPAGAAPGGQTSLFGEPDPDRLQDSPWVIDFKTHRAEPPELEAIAEGYAVQTRAYRDAATALDPGGDAEVRVALHFTHPNVAIEV